MTHAPRPSARRPVLAAVHGLRFVAAAHVMLEHSLRARLLPRPVLAAIGAGYTSVTFLLVLSGFILVYAYSAPDGSLTVSRREFYAARFSRIFPLFVVSQLLVLPLYLRSHGWGETWFPLAVGITGQQAWFPSLAHVLNTPAWPISLLVLAYAAFPWLLDRLRAFPARFLPAAMAATWAVSLVPCLLLLHAGATGTRFLYTFPLVRFPEFLLGMLLGKWFLSREPLNPRAAAWAVLGAFCAWAAVLAVVGRIPRPLIHNGLIAPVFVVLLIGLASGGGRVVGILSRAWMQRLGHAGIAIFLLHLPLVTWLEAAGWYPGPTTAASALVYAGYLAGTLALSLVATEHFVEPISTWARRRATGRQAAAQAVGAIAAPKVA